VLAGQIVDMLEHLVREEQQHVRYLEEEEEDEQPEQEWGRTQVTRLMPTK